MIILLSIVLGMGIRRHFRLRSAIEQFETNSTLPPGIDVKSMIEGAELKWKQNIFLEPFEIDARDAMKEKYYMIFLTGTIVVQYVTLNTVVKKVFLLVEYRSAME